MDRVTFATSSGLVWLALAVHYAAGLVSILAGAVALSVPKGGRLHRQSGVVFTWAMIVLGLMAAGIGSYEQVPSQVFAGLLATYLVFSGMTTVKPLPGIGHRANVALMLLAFAYAVASLYGGVTEWLDPTIEVVGRPRVVPPLVIGTVILLAAIVPLLLVLAFAPLLFLFYWMWRVRLRGRLSGIIVGGTP